MHILDFEVPDSYRAQYYFSEIQKHAALLDICLNSKKTAFLVFDIEHILKSVCKSISFEADKLIAPIIAEEIYREKQRNGLKGSSPTERYESFFLDKEKTSWSDKAKSLPKQYPDAFKTISTLIENFFINICECVERIEHSKDKIATFLNIHDQLQITEIASSDSDRHYGGRQVIFLTFQENKKLVYKPRSLQTDILVAQYISALSMPDTYQPMVAKIVYTDEKYGWCEYIEHIPCTNDPQIKNFYKNTGAMLAVLDSLNFTDGHHENFLAHGSKIALIDCETILTNLSYYDGKIDPTKVAFTGMLQEREEDKEAQDKRISGLHAETLELFYPLHLFILNERTDALAIHYRCIIKNEKILNSPTGKVIHIKDYKDEVLEGYKYAAGRICEKRAELKEIVQIHAANLMPRQLIRHTMYYSLLLLKMNHPSIFTENKLKPVDDFLDIFLSPYTGKIADIEKSELKKYSIPLYYQRIEDAGLYSYNNFYQKNFFTRTAIEDFHTKAAYFSSDKFLETRRQEILSLL